MNRAPIPGHKQGDALRHQADGYGGFDVIVDV
jgi:hypothetical protein